MSRSRGRVRQKVKKIFPSQDADLVQEILDLYGVESCETGRTRVHLAVLKVFQEGGSGGEGPQDGLERLRSLVRAAKSDFRDVVAWAEYPEEMRTGYREMRRLSPEDARALRKRDREQYLGWLNGT